MLSATATTIAKFVNVAAQNNLLQRLLFITYSFSKLHLARNTTTIVNLFVLIPTHIIGRPSNPPASLSKFGHAAAILSVKNTVPLLPRSES
jgi:hypothetical protein